MDVDDSRGVDEAEFAAFLQRKLRSPPLGHSVSHGTILLLASLESGSHSCGFRAKSFKLKSAPLFCQAPTAMASRPQRQDPRVVRPTAAWSSSTAPQSQPNAAGGAAAAGAAVRKKRHLA